MLKKLRLRFICISMTAFALIAFLLILAINLANYYRTTAGHDEVLQGIHEYNHSIPDSGQEPPQITEMPWAGGPDAEFTFRFFSIRCSKDGSILIFDADYISSIDETAAEEYARTVLDRRKTSGYYQDYRYLVTEEGDDIEIIFLNVADANNYRNVLLMVSCFIGVGGLLLLLLLITLFSGSAIRPYVKNLEQQKQFITDAGHELKTPVTSIATCADILALEYTDNEWIDNIRKQSARLSKLIGDLVLLSRLDEEQPFPEIENFSLSEAVWELSEHFASLAAAHGKIFRQDIADDILYSGSRSSIQQMVSILLDNAIRYSDPQGTIHLSLCKKHNSIHIEVYNTCDSVPEIDLNRLFDRFYRPDSSRSVYTGGSGIGLSIARAVAERHGGSISASSADRRSITFSVTL